MPAHHHRKQRSSRQAIAGRDTCIAANTGRVSFPSMGPRSRSASMSRSAYMPPKRCMYSTRACARHVVTHRSSCGSTAQASPIARSAAIGQRGQHGGQGLASISRRHVQARRLLLCGSARAVHADKVPMLLATRELRQRSRTASDRMMFSGNVSYVSRNQGYSRSTSRLRAEPSLGGFRAHSARRLPCPEPHVGSSRQLISHWCLVYTRPHAVTASLSKAAHAVGSAGYTGSSGVVSAAATRGVTCCPHRSIACTPSLGGTSSTTPVTASALVSSLFLVSYAELTFSCAVARVGSSTPADSRRLAGPAWFAKTCGHEANQGAAPASPGRSTAHLHPATSGG